MKNITKTAYKIYLQDCDLVIIYNTVFKHITGKAFHFRNVYEFIFKTLEIHQLLKKALIHTCKKKKQMFYLNPGRTCVRLASAP